MAIAVVTETLSGAIGQEIFSIINEYFEKRKISENDKTELKKNLKKLVPSANRLEF